MMFKKESELTELITVPEAPKKKKVDKTFLGSQVINVVASYLCYHFMINKKKTCSFL